MRKKTRFTAREVIINTRYASILRAAACAFSYALHDNTSNTLFTSWHKTDSPILIKGNKVLIIHAPVINLEIQSSANSLIDTKSTNCTKCTIKTNE